jgi:hypothetical protein
MWTGSNGPPQPSCIRLGLGADWQCAKESEGTYPSASPAAFDDTRPLFEVELPPRPDRSRFCPLDGTLDGTAVSAERAAAASVMSVSVASATATAAAAGAFFLSAAGVFATVTATVTTAAAGVSAAALSAVGGGAMPPLAA